MKKKTKGLLQLLLIISLLLAVMAGFFVWDASRQLPLAAGDRIRLAQGMQGDVATIGITLFNNGRRTIKLRSVQLEGTGWELSTAQMTQGLTYTEQPLETWASQHRAPLTPAYGYRLAKSQSATLGISLKRTASATTAKHSLVVKYRLWFFNRELRISLD